MGVIARAKKRRLGEEEREVVNDLISCKKSLEEEPVDPVDDRISSLLDAVLGDIVSLLPSKDGTRTQVLSSRWHHIWRSAPLNFDFYRNPVTASEICNILSSHPGPGRRFTIHMGYVQRKAAAAAATLEAWLRCPALNNLQELEFCLSHLINNHLPPFPASVRRFSCTLRVTSFGACNFPNENASVLHLLLLKQLSLVYVTISETSLHAMLAGCSVLESLLLKRSNGFLRVRIVSTKLRSIGVCSSWRDDRLRQLIIEDAPCMERLLIFGYTDMDISVIYAPRLNILGNVSGQFPGLQFGATTSQGPSIVTLTTAVCSVKVLALDNVNLSLDEVINFIKCFPCLEKVVHPEDLGEKNTWYRKYRNLIGTLDIQLKKIVLSYYRGNKSHVNFTSFFVSNATVLESMRFELEDGNVNSVWIERQHRLLQIEKRASRSAQFYFVSHNKSIGRFYNLHAEQEQVHDLSTADPFERFHN